MIGNAVWQRFGGVVPAGDRNPTGTGDQIRIAPMKTRRNRYRMMLVALGLAAMLIVGCGDRATEAPPATDTPTKTAVVPVVRKPRTIVRFALVDIEVPIYEDLIAQFEEENPDLGVEIVSVNQVLGLGPLASAQAPDDAEDRLVAAADVVKMGISRETVEKGLVRDLRPLIEADQRFDEADFVAGALEAYQWEGGSWALPIGVNFRLVFYSKDAFDAVGEPYPQPGWTWDDFVAKARAVTSHEGGEVSQWGFVCPTALAYRLVESKAGELVDYGVDPPVSVLDGSSVSEALSWYVDLHLRDGVMPYSGPQEESDTPSLSEGEALIDKGLAAMWPEYSLLLSYRKMQGNVGVAPFPVDAPSSRTTPGWPMGVSMSAGTTQPAAAWRWMVFLSRQSLRGVGQGVDYLPARRSAAEAGGYWEKLDEELAEPLRYALEHGYVVREPVAYNAFTDAVHAVLDERETVEEALAAAQARTLEDSQAKVLGQIGATPVPTVQVVPAGSQDLDDASVTRISFVPGLGSFNLEPYRALADRFHEEEPEIRVEVKMLDLTQAGGAPDLRSMAESADCFQWYPSLKDPRNLDAILSLEPFLQADVAFDTDDYFPQLLGQFTEQGELWGLPADVTPFVIEYNRDLFEDAGVDYPSVGWTWEDFLDTAAALTKGEGDAKQYGFVAEVYESNDLLLMLERLGANLIDDRSDRPVLTLDDADSIEAMSWYASLSTDYGVKPVFITDLTKLAGASAAYLEREGLINKGRAAMWTSSGTMAALFGPRQDLDIGVAPLPSRADGSARASLLTTSGYFISAGSEERLACWKWLTFLTQEATAVQGFPARKSLAESAEYRKQAGEARAAAYLSSVRDAETPSSFEALSEEDWMGGAMFWVFQAYGKVLRGEAEAEGALDEAQRLAEAYQDCLIAAGDTSQETWQGCLKATDPTLPDFIFAQGN